jgi:hypothetical protein
MKWINSVKISALFFLSILFVIIFLPGCYVIQKYQKNVPFVFKNNISLKAEKASKDEQASIKSKLYTQLDDSAKVNVKDKFFIFHYISQPPSFDTNAVIQSVANMNLSLRNQGFYNPDVSYSYDTVSAKKGQERVTINYKVDAGNRTLIDTLAYLLL